MRQIFLDTETTGLQSKQGDRVIEIAAVELIHRRPTEKRFHVYLNPEREVPEEAQNIHGITTEFLLDKPLFSAVASDFLAFIKEAELIIHNAPFDVGFLDMELQRAGYQALETYISEITDTLVMARESRPGQRNSLDALCKFYNIDNSKRTLHGALLDAELLAEVYIAMTRGQESLLMNLNENNTTSYIEEGLIDGSNIKVIKCAGEDLNEHQSYIKSLLKNGASLW